MVAYGVQAIFCSSYPTFVLTMMTLTVPKGATGGVFGVYVSTQALGGVLMTFIYEAINAANPTLNKKIMLWFVPATMIASGILIYMSSFNYEKIMDQ